MNNEDDCGGSDEDNDGGDGYKDILRSNTLSVSYTQLRAHETKANRGVGGGGV